MEPFIKTSGGGGFCWLCFIGLLIGASFASVTGEGDIAAGIGRCNYYFCGLCRRFFRNFNGR